MNNSLVARAVPAWRRSVAVAALPLLLAAAPAVAQIKDFACFACIHDEITHKWRIPDHPVFWYPEVIKEHCAAIEYPTPEFNVVCDGTQVSEFEIRHTRFQSDDCSTSVDVHRLPLPYFLDENWEKVLNADPNMYGVIEATAQGTDYVNFKYTNPIECPAEGEPVRDVVIAIEYEDTHEGGREIVNTMVIHVNRPPVVMTHGLWSERGAFQDMEDDFKATLYDAALLYRVDYKASNDHAFITNYRWVEDGIDKVFEQAADAGFAAGKVDLVGHSMGGILSRLYVQSPYYDQEVRRIVTCNTPHGGSQMANLLLDDAFPLSGAACTGIWLKSWGTDSCGEGAVEDLRVTSAAIGVVLNDPLSYPSLLEVHAVKTLVDLDSAAPALSPTFGQQVGFPTLIYNVLRGCAIPWYESVFNGDGHDLIVAAASQGGGLQLPHQSEVSNQGHIGSVANPAVIARVRELLSLPRGAGELTNTYYSPEVEQYFTPNAVCPAPLVPFHGLAAETLAITEPASGASVQAGQELTVSVAGSAGVATVILGLSDAGGRLYLAEQPGPSPSFQVEVPDEMIGEARLFAIGLPTLGTEVMLSDAVTLEVGVSATLTSLAAYPSAAHLKVGGTETLEITGQYDDGVERDLSQLAGLAFAFAEGHASKSGTSGVTLDERLDDTLTITYQGVSSPEVRIRALPPEQPQVPSRPVRRRLTRK